MGSGPDGDDEELVDIEIELDGPPPRPPESAVDTRPGSAPPQPPPGAGARAPEAARPPIPVPVRGDPRETTDAEAPDIIELRQPIVEAAETDARADIALYEAEAAATDDPARRAALLVEVARLAEIAPEASASGEGGQDRASEDRASEDRAGEDRALEAARRAFAAAPSFTAALWCLRGQLERAGQWQELADAYQTAETAVAASGAEAAGGPAATARAEMLVARGRLLEDRLGRDADAIASYRAALAAAPDDTGALLALLLAGLRTKDPGSVAVALEGLARRADDPARRAALNVDEARAGRDVADGAAYALGTLEAELGRSDDGAAIGTLLAEVETFTGPSAPAEVAARALAQLARRAAPGAPAFAVGLLRERARLLARAGDSEAALEALDEAGRLDPTHPLVSAERITLGERLGRGDAVDALARELVAAAGSDDAAVDLALSAAGVALRAGRDAAGGACLEAPGVAARRGARADLRAFELALAIRRRDGVAVASTVAAQADTGGAGADDARARANALAAAGAIRQWAIGDAPGAEELWRRALALAPAHGPALEALVALLGGGRAAEAADLLEVALEAGAGAALETWARTTLVSIYADELGEPARALPHQRRLVAAAPDDVARRVRLHDLELGGMLGIGEPALETLLALADRAVDPGVAVALRVEAARGLADAPDPAARARAAALLEELTAVDPTGLAAAARERAAASSEARAEVGAGELEAALGDAPADTVRALRFRLAHHHAAGGHYAEALAALTPQRSEGDPLARAWSYELARRSGDAILEVAVLSEEARAPDPAQGDDADQLLAHAEALARAGDPSGAGAMLRRVLALGPAGPGAADAALALHRLAAADTRAGADALPEALRALAVAAADDPELAAAATREEGLERVAAGTVAPADLEALPGSDSLRARAEAAVIRFVAGARLGDARAVAGAMLDLATSAAGEGSVPLALVPLLARAAARARLAGAETAEAIAGEVWRRARRPELAPALVDLPIAGGGPWPAGRADPRRAHARRSGGATGLGLELEIALDAELRGALGTALAAYGSVIAVDPERIEAWTGVRRVARAGGDLLGEARALARLGALCRDPERAAALLADAADAYERAERPDDGVTCLAKAVELRPADAALYQRLHEQLRGDLGHPGRAAMFDNLLGHRLAVTAVGAPARVALLYERAQHRLHRLQDRPAAFDDLKQILSIAPEHREALQQLAAGALEDRDGPEAVLWLERFLAVAPDDPRAGAARLDLAAAYESVKDRGRAVETLRRAAAAQPADATPFNRLADLQLRAGDWRAAIEALRAAEPRVHEARARAALHLRIGAVLRDLGRDPAGAAASFRRAAEIDPVGDGTRALVALQDAAGDASGGLETVERELGLIRRALATDPLDPQRLERLREFLGVSRARGLAAPIAEAETAVASVLDLLASGWAPIDPAAVPPFRPAAGRALFDELVDPAAAGFVAELWPNLVEVAEALHPAAAGRERRAAPIARGDARFAWVQPIANGLGLPELELSVSRDPHAELVAALPEPAFGLVFAPGAETAPELRFAVGRLLGLYAQHGGVLERVSADKLAPLFACAAAVAGAAPPAGFGVPTEELVRSVSRTLSRKHRKALGLQASRFAFETFDLPAWHAGVLRTADRLGLLVAGDVATAAVALAGATRAAVGPTGDSSGSAATPAARVAASRSALELVRFALGDRYPLLRRAASGEGLAVRGGRPPGRSP